MTRQFCDCCRNEFKDKEEYGVLQMTTNLYNGITRGESVVLHNHSEEDENTNPFARVLRGHTRPTVTQLEICIECLRRIVALREQVNLLYRQGHLNVD